MARPPWPARPVGYLAALALAVAATWPVALDLDGLLVGEKITSATYIVQNALAFPPWRWLDLPFPDANFPDGGRGVLVALPQIAVTGLLAPLAGPYAALNLSLLLHLALGVWAGARLTAMAWDPCPWPAALAGGVGMGLGGFALGTWATGQPENVGVGWVLLAVELGWRWLREGRRAALAGALGCAGLAFLSSPYLLMGPLLAAPVPLLVGARRHGLFRTATFTVGLAAVVGALALPYRTTLAAREEGAFLCPASLDATVPAEARHDLARDPPARMLRPAPVAAELETDLAGLVVPGVAGRAAKHAGPLGYLGLPTLLLAAALFRRSPRAATTLTVAAAVPLVLSLGDAPRVNGWLLTWDGAPLRLPLALLRDVPVLGAVLGTIQVPARLALGVQVPLALAAAGTLAGLGRPLAGLGAAASPVAPRVATALAALLVAEALAVAPAGPPHAAEPLLRTDAHRWLATQPDGLGVVDAPPLGFTRSPPFPPPIGLARRLLQTAREHGHPVPYSGCYPPLLNAKVLRSGFATALEDVAVAGGTPADLRAEARALGALGYGWLAWLPGRLPVDPAAEARVGDALAGALELAWTGADGTRVYRLPGGPGATPPPATGRSAPSTPSAPPAPSPPSAAPAPSTPAPGSP